MKPALLNQVFFAMVALITYSNVQASGLPPSLSCDINEYSIPVTPPDQPMKEIKKMHSQIAQFVRNANLDPVNDTAQLVIDLTDGSHLVVQATTQAGKEDMIYLSKDLETLSGKNVTFKWGSALAGFANTVSCEIYR